MLTTRYMTSAHRWLPLWLLCAFFMAGCSGDSDTPDTPDVPPTPEPGATVLRIGGVEQAGLTRADNGLSSIALYVTTYQDGGWKVAQSRVSYVEGQSNPWQSLATVKEDTDYYLYGFMPADAPWTPAITTLNGSYENGAVMTMTNVSALASQDLCVLVAVKGKNETGTLLSKEGSFAYRLDSSGESVDLLFDHIYALLDFQVKVDAGYDKLRDITLKQIALTANQQVSKVTVTLTAGATPAMQVAYTLADGASTANIAIKEGQGVRLTTAAQAITGFFAPDFSGELEIESTYDVYDKQGNLLRENSTATNKLTGLGTFGHGDKKTVVMTVKPTYLYMLSDPDLDSPTVTIN